MGKKKDKSKGKGAAKTEQKTQKKAAKKSNKELAALGEENIEALIADFTAKDRLQNETIVERCSRPSPRLYSSFVAHPSKDELILYGGEFFNGSKTIVYNDLFTYNVKKQQWFSIRSPNGPPPRCSHQAVIAKQAGGQMWVFGGEFVSPSQNQFYHYKDLWSFSLSDHKWSKVAASNGPSARSGHRMVLFKKLLLVFGGFHDNNRECRYYNDLHAFNLETYKWEKLEVSGTAPSPRSACKMCVVQEGPVGVIVYGGYSKAKVKKDSDKGVVHTDMYRLSPADKNKEDMTPLQWKWSTVKQSGLPPPPRSNFELATISGDRALLFGGVHDEEDADDDTAICSNFYQDSYILNLTSGKWHELTLRGDGDIKRKVRRKKKAEVESMDTSEGGAVGEEQEKLENLELDDEGGPDMTTTYDDGVFKVSVGTGTGDAQDDLEGMELGAEASGGAAPLVPKARMCCQMTHRDGVMYLYGGMYEALDQQVTMDDFYSLNMDKLDSWRTIDAGTYSQQEWLESESSEEEEDADEEEESEGDEDDETPSVQDEETLQEYFTRTKEYWMEVHTNTVDADAQENMRASESRRHAFLLAESFFKESQ